MKPLIPFLTTTVLLSAAMAAAGPEKVAFPSGYTSWVLYTIVDRYDIKQYRELYAPPEAIQAAREGKPLPAGTAIVLVQYKAQVDASGSPRKDANGRFLKGDLIAYAAMEKRAGWGREYPEELRNGEWEYAAFTPDRKLNDKANYTTCFQCHKPHEKLDFVFSYDRMAARVSAPAPPVSAGAGVKIASFVFGPDKLSVAAGNSVTWTNADDSPHEVVVTGTPVRSGLVAKGQSFSHRFDAPGVYPYACGLHPGMKGTIEVLK